MRFKSCSALALLLAIACAPALAEGRKIVRERTPVYPEMARKFALHGTVTMQVTVASNGHVLEAKVLGGHPMLAKAALDSVNSWVFEPAATTTTETVKVDFKE
jgi:TonB family protein